MDWTIGTHGLRISFTYHGRRYGSTYLPDVAREQGWTKEETIVSLMRKAGWSGRKDDWRKVGLNVVRYQGRQVKLRFSEWEAWREWVEEVEGASA
jgi:AMMECR1 domain-containing protein